MHDTVHGKHNITKSGKNCHPYNTRIGSGYISYGRKLAWWESKIDVRIYGDVKYKKKQVRGVPCKWSQQVTAKVQPMLAAQVNSAVRLNRTRMVNSTFSHHILWSWHVTNHISHTCGRRSCRPARYLSKSSTHSHSSERCVAHVFLNHYRILRTTQIRGSKATGFPKLGHEGSTTSSHAMTPLVYSFSSTYSNKLYLYFSWNAHFTIVGDPSYSLVLDWRRRRSTRRYIRMNVPKSSWTRDERSGILVKFICDAKLRTYLAFCTPPSLYTGIHYEEPNCGTPQHQWVQKSVK